MLTLVQYWWQPCIDSKLELKKRIKINTVLQSNENEINIILERPNLAIVGTNLTIQYKVTTQRVISIRLTPWL